MYDTIKSNANLLDKKFFKITTVRADLTVYNEIKSHNSVFITAPEPEYLSINSEKKDIAKALNIDKNNIDSSMKTDFINAGLNTLIVPINSLKNCVETNPDFMTLQNFTRNNGIDIVLIFSNETYLAESNYRTRVFAPKYGYLEDPATGSGNSAFGYYLLKCGMDMPEGAILNIEQGNTLDRANKVKLKVEQIDNKKRILFGGGAIVEIEGNYYL